MGATRLSVVGFGSDAEIDAAAEVAAWPASTAISTRAIDGLSLRKFFGLNFGNIFEAGA